MRKYILILVPLLAAWLPAASSRLDDTANVETRRKELNRLLAEKWEYEMHESPEYATVTEDYRYNDHWSVTRSRKPCGEVGGIDRSKARKPVLEFCSLLLNMRERVVAEEAQTQIAMFFSSDGQIASRYQ
jgi:hypothetical protein